MTYTESGPYLRTNWSLRTGRKPATGTNDPSESANTSTKCGKCLKFTQIHLQNQNRKHRKGISGKNSIFRIKFVHTLQSRKKFLSHCSLLLSSQRHVLFPSFVAQTGITLTKFCTTLFQIRTFLQPIEKISNNKCGSITSKIQYLFHRSSNGRRMPAIIRT